MTDSFLPPAGWHADPGGTPLLLRWWDGMAWTEYTRPYGDQSAARVQFAPPAPDAYPALTPARGRAGRVQRDRTIRRNNAFGYAALAVGIISLLLNPLGIPSVFAIIFAGIGLARASRLSDIGVTVTGRGFSIAGLVIGLIGLGYFLVRIMMLTENALP